MVRVRRVALVATLALLLVAGGVVPAAAEDERGFMLIGTDAAYADYSLYLEDFGGPGVDYIFEVWTGYVYAKLLRYDDGEIVMPHTDVGVQVCLFEATDPNGCFSSATPMLEGVVGPTEYGDGYASIVKLASAEVVEIDVPVARADGLSAVVGLTLEWTATGDIIREVTKTPTDRTISKTRLAEATGSITLSDVSDGGHLLALLAGTYDVGGADPDMDPIEGSPLRITHYNQFFTP